MKTFSAHTTAYTKYIGWALLFALGIASRDWYHTHYQSKWQTSSIHPPTSTLQEKLIQGQQLHATKKIDEALRIYHSAYDDITGLAQLNIQTGLSLQEKKQYDQALIHFQHALEINPSLLVCYFLIGQLLQQQKKYTQALDWYTKLLTLQPNSFDAHLQIGNTLYNLDRCQEALDYAQKAALIDPQNFYAPLHAGYIYNKMGNFDGAVAAYKQAINLNPNLANAHYNLGHTLKYMGKLDQALTELDKAIALQPHYPDAHIARAQCLIALGDFKQGLAEYEWRWALHGIDHTLFSASMWHGQDLHDKSIVLFCEQGLGDTLQFIRYAQQIKQHGAHVIAYVQNPLVKLLSNCPYIDQVISNKSSMPKANYQAALMSLPHILNTTIQTIPAPIPYLKADPHLIEFWRHRLATDKNFKIGICWHVDPEHELTKLPSSKRSVPLQEFLPLAKIPGISFYSLQKFVGIEELPQAQQLKIHTFDTNFDEQHGRFMDTAAVIENMDLIISVDTSIIHLAAAMGKKVWTLLPFSPDCRWHLERTDTPWYPTMTLFRAHQPEQWTAVITDIKKALAQEIKNKHT